MKSRTYTAAYQSRMAVEAIRGEPTVRQIASRLEPSSLSPVTAWKQPALEGLKGIFFQRRGAARREELYAQMGRFQMEVKGLEKL